MRFITISAAVLLGSALSAANAQQIRAANATPSAKTNVMQKGVSGPGTHMVSGGSDTCGTATAISGVGLFSGDNIGATTDGPAAPCMTIGADVWYDWTATATGLHTFSLCAAGGGTANYDTGLVIYNTSACVGTVAACNDDTCALQSQVAFAVTSGNVYKIRVGGFGTVPATGTFTLSITSAGGPPANDDCATPTLIAGCGGPPFAFNNAAATTSAQGQTNANCLFFGTMGISNDLWYSWTAPSTGSFTLALCGGSTMDSKVAIYNGTGCPGAAAIACNDDSCGLQSSVGFAATIGNPYTIQLGNFPTAAGGSGTFTISCPAAPAGPCDTLDDGTTEDSVGTNNPAHDILWMHSQSAVGITTIVNSISTAWGSVVGGGGPPNGTPARVGIWSDPNNDGNPTDAVLIGGPYPTVVSGTGTNAFTTVIISPGVIVTDKYFIGASCTGGTFPAPLDQSSGAGAGRVWIVASTVGPINYASIGTEEIPPTDEDTVAPGVWLLRGDCKDAGVVQICSANGANCPCGNQAAGPGGCQNSATFPLPVGADLGSVGNASVGGDTLSIAANNVRKGNPTTGLFFQGPGVPPNAVNDGLLCTGNPLLRLWSWKRPGPGGGVTTLTGPDNTTLPDTTGVSISQRSAAMGHPIVAGEKLVYTVWYRDPANFACPSPATSNYTNGLQVTWGP